MRLVLLMVVLSSVVCFSQNSSNTRFDIADFNEKMKVARWLYEYDMVAWQTSDSVMAQPKEDLKRLGQEWFCIQKNDHWHAIYGKYENNEFDLVFHFKLDEDGTVNLVKEELDTNLLHRYSRALQTANNELLALRDSVSLRFNQYIRENEDKTFSVWILPAFQPNSVAVYGGEFIYTIDETGRTILNDESFYSGAFRGFEVGEPREIWLNYSETEKPTLGAVFFVWYYKSYFTKIYVDNANSFSTVVNSDGNWSWIHAEKMPEKKKRKRKKNRKKKINE